MMHFSKNLKMIVIFILVVALSPIVTWAGGEEGTKLVQLEIGQPGPLPTAIIPLSPLADCVGEVTQSVNTSLVTFEWGWTGLFSSFEVIIYDNPCGRYPPTPPTTPTPPPTTLTPTPGEPIPTLGEPTPTTPPVTTTAGVWEPLWEKLCPEQRASLEGLSGWEWVRAARALLEGKMATTPTPTFEPFPEGGAGLPFLPPGWEWGSAGPTWTGEGPEPPQLPSGWEWGPLGPRWVGEGTLPEARVLGTSGPISPSEMGKVTEEKVEDQAFKFSIKFIKDILEPDQEPGEEPAEEPSKKPGLTFTWQISPGEMVEVTGVKQAFEFPLKNILEPGQAFIWQVYGVYQNELGEESGILSEPQCLRYQPICPETEEICQALPCVPTCKIRVETKVDPAMDGGLDPITEKLTIKRDDFVPLKAVGLDFDQLWWYCEPDPSCPEQGSERMAILTGKVRYEWEITAGEGDFVEIGCQTPVKKDVGNRVIFMPPYVEKGKMKVTQILLKIIDDNPSQPIDPMVKRKITIITERDKEGGNTDEYKISILSGPYKLPAPVIITPTLCECRAEPAKWDGPDDLMAGILTPPDDTLAFKEWVRLEAIDLQDPDVVSLSCSSIRCIPDGTKQTYNDDIRWTWSIVKGGGKFIKGNVGRFVIYEAPLQETEVEIEVKVDNPYGLQCADKIPPPAKIKLKIVKPGIRMELTSASWLPQRGNVVKKKSYLVYKKGNKWVEALAHMCRIHKFKLLDVSKEKGYCLNKGDTKDTSHDLWIPEGKGHECSGLHPFAARKEKFYQKAETKKPTREYTIEVKSEDYGAWGFIRSTANPPYESVPWKKTEVPNLNGRGLKREFADNRVTIPFDADENHISDRGWTSFEGSLITLLTGISYLEKDPKDAKIDTDAHSRSNFPGDGLSAYEEYRGFFSRGNHIRLSPSMKELFIYDQHGLVASSFFSRASGLIVIFINNNEWSGTGTAANKKRIVNFNATSFTCGVQHGLHVINNRTATPGDLGLTEGPNLGPPRTADPRVIVYTVRLRRWVERLVRARAAGGDLTKLTANQRKMMRERIALEIRMTTTHECGHGVGIRHHQPDPPATSGDKTCVMRYYDAADENKVGNLLRDPWPTTFCGVCKPQIHVKDN